MQYNTLNSSKALNDSLNNTLNFYNYLNYTEVPPHVNDL